MVCAPTPWLWHGIAYFVAGLGVLVGFLLIVIIGGMVLAPRSTLAYLALVIPLTVIIVLIARHTTRGGWRWRWGDDE